MESHYRSIILMDGKSMKRDKAFENCGNCGSEKGSFHKAYCEKEICPLCGKYISECHHMEGYESDFDHKESSTTYKGTA